MGEETGRNWNVAISLHRGAAAVGCRRLPCHARVRLYFSSTARTNNTRTLACHPRICGKISKYPGEEAAVFPLSYESDRAMKYFLSEATQLAPTNARLSLFRFIFNLVTYRNFPSTAYAFRYFPYRFPRNFWT